MTQHTTGLSRPSILSNALLSHPLTLSLSLSPSMSVSLSPSLAFSHPLTLSLSPPLVLSLSLHFLIIITLITPINSQYILPQHKTKHLPISDS